MSHRRPPSPLQAMAMDILVGFFTTFCHEHSFKASLDELRQGVSFIKTNIGSQMPQKLAAEFHNRLLKEFSWSSGYPRTIHAPRYVRIVSNIIMDENVIGLRCSSMILGSLHLEDLHRIRGFTELNLHREVPHSLTMLYLEDLTTFKYIGYCTDADLVVISHNCPKLKHVDVLGSKEVTDVGLLALISCSNLRFVSVARCSEVSLRGVQDFLSVNRTIRKLYAWPFCDYPGFNYFQDPNWAADISVHPSIESFTIQRSSISDDHLRSIVTKFPNLNDIKLDGKLTGDVCILKSLNDLSKIDYYVTKMGQTCAELEPLWRCVGAQITHLKVQGKQRDLNTLFELCKNLEYLYFELTDEYYARVPEVVLPPFQKLKVLDLKAWNEGEDYVFKFGQMLKLENLEMKIPLSTHQIMSIILDHQNFPRLKRMGVSDVDHSDPNEIDDLTQIAKNNNLDLVIPYY